MSSTGAAGGLLGEIVQALHVHREAPRPEEDLQKVIPKPSFPRARGATGLVEGLLHTRAPLNSELTHTNQLVIWVRRPGPFGSKAARPKRLSCRRSTGFRARRAMAQFVFNTTKVRTVYLSLRSS